METGKKIKSKLRFYSCMIYIMLTLPSFGFSSNSDSLFYEIIFNEELLNYAKIKEHFINALEITPDKFILLATPNQFYVSGWAGIKPLGKYEVNGISSFAYTPDSLLLVVQKNEIRTYDSSGTLNKILSLPSSKMALCAGKSSMYIFDQNPDNPKHAVFIWAKHGKYLKLVELPFPILAVAENNKSLLFSTQNILYQYKFDTKKIIGIAALAGGNDIISIQVDSSDIKNKVIYFSSSKAVYALKDSSVVSVTDKLGGSLKYYNGGLIIYDSTKNLLVRILGISQEVLKKIASGKQNQKIVKIPASSRKQITNSTIVKMTQAMLANEIILSVISSSDPNFNLSIDSMIYLSDQQVSSTIILAMKNAMKNKSSTEGIPPSSTNLTTAQNLSTPINSIAISKNTIKNNFFIIALSYPTEQSAKEAVETLKKQGFPNAQLVGKNDAGAYRIAYKGYPTNEEAMKDLIQIKKTINSEAWIFEKKE